MKFLIFADLHGHNFKEFSYIDENGVNSRLAEQVTVLDRITKDASENEVDAVLFLGDLTHLKNNMDTQVLKLLSSCFNHMARLFPLFIIPGNHDYRLWGYSPAFLELFKNFENQIQIADVPGFLHEKFEDCNDVFIPYTTPYTRSTSGMNEVLSKISGDVFLGHQDIIGVHYGGFLVEKGFDADILSSKFKISFLGHCHESFKVRDNVISVGAPLQHTFSDEGGKRGWWILDFDKGVKDLKFIENTISPKFYSVDYYDDGTKIPGNPEVDYYRITVHGKLLPSELGVIRHKRITYKFSGKESLRSTIKFSDSSEDIITKYVDMRAGDLDKNKLVTIGREFFHGVK